MLRLTDEWREIIINQRETGMGYYIVTIKLKDGRTFKQTIIDSGYITRIRGLKEIPFTIADIEDIIVTHDRWDYRKG